MIYTITCNPSIDYIVQVKDFKCGTVNRVFNDEKYAGGKGINVSRVLNNLGIKSKVLGFIGGFTGEFVDVSLRQHGVDTDFIKVKGDTRINVKLKSKEETEINGAGPEITKEDLEKLFLKIENLNSEDFLVLAGNVQKSLPTDIYALIQQKCQGKGAKVIVDTTGQALTDSLKYKPFLIKPNNHELSQIFDVNIENKEDVIKYANKLRVMGAENVIVSMAGQGAILICDKGVYHASVPKGIVKNSVGAGDSLIGGFLAHYSITKDIVEAFKWGAASGSATAFSLDLCEKHQVEKLLDEISIAKLS